jgi:hypothetical protein
MVSIRQKYMIEDEKMIRILEKLEKIHSEIIRADKLLSKNNKIDEEKLE